MGAGIEKVRWMIVKSLNGYIIEAGVGRRLRGLAQNHPDCRGRWGLYCANQKSRVGVADDKFRRRIFIGTSGVNRQPLIAVVEAGRAIT
jgi:hypothetical protein